MLDGISLARVFYTLKANNFGLEDYSIRASLKNPTVISCFNKLSASLREWKSAGMSIDVGDYFKALFEVFGKNIFPSHVLAECGLPIYIKYRISHTPPESPLTDKERLLFRERYIKEVQSNYGWSREEVVKRFGNALPD